MVIQKNYKSIEGIPFITRFKTEKNNRYANPTKKSIVLKVFHL